MNSLVTIQTNVPMCPDCSAKLTFNPISLVYICVDCHVKFKVIDFGHSEREFICERGKYDTKRNVNVPGKS